MPTDPEIAAVEAVAAVLAPLDLHTRLRILEWANDRFGRRSEVDWLEMLCSVLTEFRPLVEKAIASALRATIDAHGPITSEHVGSAAKRVYGTLLSGGHLAGPSTDVGPGTG